MTPARQLAAFLARFSPDVARQGRGALARVGKLVPASARRFVYDNYNGLVVGFGPNERASDAVVSILIARDHVTLCFINDAPRLPDPERLLKGSGTMVRHIRLDSAADLDRPAVRALIRTAIARSDVPFAPTGKGPLVIKSISAKQRPRR